MNKKLHFIIPVLVIILLMSFAALCNLGGDQAAEDVADDSLTQAAEDNEQQEEAKEEQDQPEEEPDLPEASDDTENKEDVADDDNNNSNQKPSQVKAPTISLKIYEGPTYSQADDICFYRIEVIATGDPKPSIKFSRDDSNGSWGNNKAQINLKRGETYNLTATATNTEGSATDSLRLDWGCGDINHNPEIAGIGLSANDLFTLTEYELSTAATDPDGDSLTYKWSVDGGTLSSSTSNPTKWETPGFPETYHITVEVSDGKGGKATETKAVRVEEIVIAAGSPPEITDIIVLYPNEPLCTETEYAISVEASDPDGDIDDSSYQWTVSSGSYDTKIWGISWVTPLIPGDYQIAVIVRDLEGHESMRTETFTVEACWQVIN